MKQTKTETLTIKVNPDEKRMIKQIAAEAGLTVSKLLYSVVFMEQKIF